MIVINTIWMRFKFKCLGIRLSVGNYRGCDLVRRSRENGWTELFYASLHKATEE